MKKLIIFFIVLFAAVWIGLRIVADPGYFLIAYHHWTIEMPLWLAIALFIILFLALHFFMRFIRYVRLFPHYIQERFRQRNAHQADEMQRWNNKLLTLTENEKAEKVWKKIPRALRKNTEIVHNYALALMKEQQSEAAEAIVRKSLQKQWDEKLVRCYGVITLKDSNRQLRRAEGWLQKHLHDAVLLLTLGRLSIRNQLWGKAVTYLENSIAFAPEPETYIELGRLFERMNQPERALSCYRKLVD